MRGESKPAAAEALQRNAGRSRRRYAQPKAGSTTAPGATPATRTQRCSRCGKSPPHSRQVCPASEVICHKCHKKGHYKRCCKTKAAIREINEDSEEEAFLGTVRANATGASTPWMTKVQLNGEEVEFKVDTGADVNRDTRESIQSRERRRTTAVESTTKWSYRREPAGTWPVLWTTHEERERLPTGRLCQQKFAQTTVGETCNRDTQGRYPGRASTEDRRSKAIPRCLQRARQAQRQLRHQSPR